MHDYFVYKWESNVMDCADARLTKDYTVIRKRRLKQRRDFGRSFAGTCYKKGKAWLHGVRICLVSLQELLLFFCWRP